MKVVYHIVAMLAIVIVLMMTGLVGYLAISDKLTGESANLIAAVLRGEKLVLATAAPPLDTVSATTHASDQVASSRPNLDLTTIQMRSALLERQRRTIEHMYSRLKDAELKLIRDREEFDKSVQLFNKQVQLRQKTNEDEGFNKALAMYTKMPPNQAKDDFMRLDLEVVVKYLMNMSDRPRTKILNEFRLPAEKERRIEITERIRTQKIAMNQKQPVNLKSN